MGNLLIRALLREDIDKLLQNFENQGWKKSRTTLENYLEQQQMRGLFMFVAEAADGDVAGYAVLYPDARCGPFVGAGIPEIADFNVFQRYQRRGIGRKILDAAEQKAFMLCDTVSLGVGLHSGYGAAQRMYVKRGYIPDGTGLWYNNTQLAQYADCNNNDELVLYLSKKRQNPLQME